jgi:hypothetical protein
MRRLTTTLGALALLGAASVVPLAPAQASHKLPGDLLAAEESFLTEVTDSAELDGQPVATGVLYDQQTGEPVIDAAVLLLAWPPNEVLDQMVPGDSLDMTPVAKAFPDAQGHFTLIPDVPLEDFADAEGTINFDLVVPGEQPNVVGVPVELTPESPETDFVSTVVDQPVADLELTVTDPASVVELVERQNTFTQEGSWRF